MSPIAIAIVLVVTAGYLAFWGGVALLVATRLGAAASATASMAVWAMLTLILPAIVGIVVTRAIPVRQGVELMMAQRQAVHGAWERPREETMRRFYARHPEWRHSAPLPAAFHWKWYFAFHQNGDDSVAAEARAYRAGLLARQGWTTRLGWVLPGVGAQGMLHRIADTDLVAQLAYHDQIAAFHRQLLAFYYPYLFNDRSFGTADFGRRPSFSPRATPPSIWSAGTTILLLVGSVLLAIGMKGLGRARAM